MEIFFHGYISIRVDCEFDSHSNIYQLVSFSKHSSLWEIFLGQAVCSQPLNNYLNISIHKKRSIWWIYLSFFFSFQTILAMKKVLEDKFWMTSNSQNWLKVPFKIWITVWAFKLIKKWIIFSLIYLTKIVNRSNKNWPIM